MKSAKRLIEKFPRPVNILLAVVSAILLILSFPGFEFWFLAWFALVPLFFAIEREKESKFASMLLGWAFGIVFFFGTLWWLTYAPINYGGVPAVLAYLLLLSATVVGGFYFGLFAAVFSILLKRLGNYAILAAPFLWTAIEFLRFWTTGNIWNSVGYSQAFVPFIISAASIGGVLLVGFLIVCFNGILTFNLLSQNFENKIRFNWIYTGLPVLVLFLLIFLNINREAKTFFPNDETATVVAVQPNVPMSGLDLTKWQTLRTRHIELAEEALKTANNEQRTTNKTIVIFPESPMNFMYERDEEFRLFLKNFAEKNNVSVIFNSAEPEKSGEQFHNSAVMVNEQGEKIAQYDKIHLMPFGEYLPMGEFLGQILPPLVGNFAFGDEYDLLPLGDARAGVMICFESHFPGLSNEFVRQGADALIEITNDGYLGNTPVLRQHLANAVFRAVETNRPVLRVTNVGITAYINERGEVLDAADVYAEATRVWQIGKSGGDKTFYVRYGEWFAWLCVIISLGVIVISFRRKSAGAN